MIFVTEPNGWTHGEEEEKVMAPTRIAYLPLVTYPQAVADEAVLAAFGFAAPLGFALKVSTFTVDIPQLTSPLGSLLIDIPELVHSAEEKSRAEARRMQKLFPKSDLVTNQVVTLSGVLDAAAFEARHFDLALLPWAADTLAAREMAEAVIFGSGRPAIIVPPSAHPALIEHLAIAWDGSRVAARALGDSLPLLAAGGKVTVLTVKDEKVFARKDLAKTMAEWLVKRGYKATAVEFGLSGKTIATALQEAAISQGAGFLAMGGFGHSRIRDFILGGATQGILSDLRLPALLSH